MSKKILFVIPTIWAGGTNSALGGLYNNIDKSQYDVTVWARDYFGGRKVDYDESLIRKQPLLSAYYSTSHYSNLQEKLFCLFVKTLKRIIKVFDANFDEKFDKNIIGRFEKSKHFDTVIAYNEGVVPFVSHFKCENKIAWVHCDYDKHLPVGRSEEKYYNKYKKIVTVSEYTTGVVEKRYPKLKDRCMTIYNLLDLKSISAKSSEIIDDSRFCTDKFTIVSVGRIVPVKNFSRIPQIAREMIDLGCNFRWYIIGPGMDSTEVDSIKDNILKFGVNDYVVWLGGKSNPYPYFKAADLYVCTSKSEACPMVFNEAKINGTPIITSDFPAAKEFIHQGQDGYVVSIDCLAKQIAHVINNPDLHSYLENNVSKYIIDNNDTMSRIYSIL